MLAGRIDAGKLGFAVQLAFWRQHGRFPDKEADVAPEQEYGGGHREAEPSLITKRLTPFYGVTPSRWSPICGGGPRGLRWGSPPSSRRGQLGNQLSGQPEGSLRPWFRHTPTTQQFRPKRPAPVQPLLVADSALGARVHPAGAERASLGRLTVWAGLCSGQCW